MFQRLHQVGTLRPFLPLWILTLIRCSRFPAPSLLWSFGPCRAGVLPFPGPRCLGGVRLCSFAALWPPLKTQSCMAFRLLWRCPRSPWPHFLPRGLLLAPRSCFTVRALALLSSRPHQIVLVAQSCSASVVPRVVRQELSCDSA